MKNETEKILDQEPRTVVKRPSVKVLEPYHDCLAKCYVVSGFREYMDDLINALIRDGFANAKDNVDLAKRQGKVEGLKELLSRSKTSFEHASKISKIEAVDKMSVKL